MSQAAARGAQQSIFGGITVILYDSFDASPWHALSVPDRYPIKLNQTLCWWETTNMWTTLGTNITENYEIL